MICQAEILPVLTSKETWCSHIEGRSVLWFVDNEAARMALVRNLSPILDNFFLLQLNARWISGIRLDTGMGGYRQRAIRQTRHPVWSSAVTGTQ